MVVSIGRRMIIAVRFFTVNLARKIFITLPSSSARVIFKSHGAFADCDDLIAADNFSGVSAARNAQGVVCIPIKNRVFAVARLVFV